MRALVLLAVVLELPLAGAAVRRLTRAPRLENRVVDGVPVSVLRPPDDEPRPAWVFVNGAHPLRRREPVVWRLANGLARAGYVVAVPDVPDLGEGTITTRALDATVAVAHHVARSPATRGGRVALIGASTGAGLALLAAARDDLAGRISVVAAVAPFADLRKLICLTTTRRYDDGGRFTEYAVTDLHRTVVARSLVAALPGEHDRDRLLAHLASIETDDLDPLEELPRRAGAVGADARAVLALLANREPERFADLWESLPEAVTSFVDGLSPLRVPGRVRAHVEIVVPPSDAYFPPAEALALARSLPDVHLTVTATLDHTRPSASLAKLKDFAAFDGFVVRGLAAAAA